MPIHPIPVVETIHRVDCFVHKRSFRFSSPEEQVMLLLLQTLFYYVPPLLFSIFFLFKWLSTAKTKRNLPPSPPKLPIIGNLHQLGVFPHRSLRSLAQQYGPLILLHFGSKPVLFVSSADAAREIMKTHDLIFSNRPKSSILRRVFYDKDVAFTPYGEYWRQVKSICVLNLLSNRRVQSFHRVREEETALLIEKIKHAASSSPVDLSEMIVSLTNDVVCRVALGRKYSRISKSGRKFKDLLRDIGELMGEFNLGDYILWLAWLNQINGLNARVEKIAKELDEFLEGVIEDHIDSKKKESNGGGSGDQDKKQQDFVDVLLEIQRENTDGFLLQRDSIKALILDMFAAGTDTTFTALEWTMTELLKHPKAMNELQHEVRVIARGKLEITEDDVEKMQYLKAVIKESIRLHPPTPLLVPRESTQDVKVMGYDIAAGTQVFINAWAIARDPLLWKDAEDFRPERFLNKSIDFKGHDFKFIPFGAGRRGCPGIQFTTSVNELALANLVHKFDFALPDGATEEDFDITEAPGISVHKKYPLLVVATPCSLVSVLAT
ncbi:cytochrome P450 736A117-like [Cornus florida]|uniref:cytochrome P450 736A117-like n=1 Tax=Cornus florida TaxID=4283 RepID=UPI00289EA471|nr:cytochrome P450 736A117-like [Cornus florida]